MFLFAILIYLVECFDHIPTHKDVTLFFGRLWKKMLLKNVKMAYFSNFSQANETIIIAILWLKKEKAKKIAQKNWTGITSLKRVRGGHSFYYIIFFSYLTDEDLKMMLFVDCMKKPPIAFSPFLIKLFKKNFIEATNFLIQFIETSKTFFRHFDSTKKSQRNIKFEKHLTSCGL